MPDLSRLHPSIQVVCALPADPTALTTEQLAAICGGDVDGVLREFASLTQAHPTPEIKPSEEVA